jgi:hypothetical protein
MAIYTVVLLVAVCAAGWLLEVVRTRRRNRAGGLPVDVDDTMDMLRIFFCMFPVVLLGIWLMTFEDSRIAHEDDASLTGLFVLFVPGVELVLVPLALRFAWRLRSRTRRIVATLGVTVALAGVALFGWVRTPGATYTALKCGSLMSPRSTISDCLYWRKNQTGGIQFFLGAAVIAGALVMPRWRKKRKGPPDPQLAPRERPLPPLRDGPA